MTDIMIERLSARVPAAPGRAARIDRLLAGLAERRLEEALQATALPPGEWCVRRLDVVVPVDLDRPDSAIESAWAASVVDGLRAALAAEGGDVVHYPRIGDALTDMVGSLAAGRAGRGWAWQRLGLLADPAGPPGTAVLAALRAHPQQALAAVTGAVAGAGAAAVHRLLGVRGWAALAELVCAVQGAPDRTPELTARLTPAAVGDDAVVPPPGLADHPAAAALARTLTGRSGLASALSDSRLRPGPATLAAWAVLVAAHADPALLRRPAAPAVLIRLAAALSAVDVGAVDAGAVDAGAVDAGAVDAGGVADRALVRPPSGGRPDEPGSAARPDPARPGGRVHHDGPVDPVRPVDPAHPARTTRTTRTAEGSPATPPLAHPARGRAARDPSDVVAGADRDRGPDARAVRPTPWAGLLFLLATAADAGVPDRLLDDPAFAARPLWWTLHRIGLLLVPADPDDPALLAFAGLRPGDPGPRTAAAPDAAEERGLGRHAGHWAAVTAARLGVPDDRPPAEVVIALAARPGEVVAEPGWVEVRLGLDQVDIDARRAGLDVDPGWVPWLGTVVRFCYA